MNEKSNICSNEQKQVNSYNALDIANYLIDLTIKNNKPLTQISILKLLYFINASYLVVNGTPLIKEKFEAWKFGPVLRELYEKYLNKYGSITIKEKLTQSIDKNLCEDKEAIEAINTVYNKLGNQKPFDLVNKTHSINGAWFNTYCTNPYQVISDIEIIREFTNASREQ